MVAMLDDQTINQAANPLKKGKKKKNSFGTVELQS
jgi:hypothetical protein